MHILPSLMRWLPRALALSLGYLASAGCGSDGTSSPTANRGEISCQRTSECDSNRFCQLTTTRVGPNLPTTTGRCVIPTGACESAATVERDCYPGARCEIRGTPGDGGVALGGRCTFAPPTHQGFAVSERITLRRPSDNALVDTTEDLSLQWEPPTARSGAPRTTVAVVMDAVPSRAPEANQIANRTHIRWIWSSADPGGPVQDGVVPFVYGSRGVSAEGSLGPRWARGTLPPGTYVWFVYSILLGEVVASSDVQKFTVMSPTPLPSVCATVIDCLVPGEIPETLGCVVGRCRRRCASDLDCEAYAGRCDFNVTTGLRTRHGAYCSLPPGSPFAE